MVTHFTGLTPLSELGEQLCSVERKAIFIFNFIFYILDIFGITAKKEDIENEN